MNENTFIMNEKKYTTESFMEAFNLTSREYAVKLLEQYYLEGRITFPSDTPKKKILDKIKDKVNIDFAIEEIEDEEESFKQSQREERAKDKDRVSFTLDCRNKMDALKCKKWIKSLGINTVDVCYSDDNKIYVKVTDVTLDESGIITRKYSRERTVRQIIDTTDKAFIGATDAINYGASNVVVPVGKIAGKAILNLTRGVINSGAKLSASLINNSSKAINQTKEDLSTDVELVKAKRQLENAKDSTIGFFRKRLNKKGGSGINML